MMLSFLFVSWKPSSIFVGYIDLLGYGNKFGLYRRLLCRSCSAFFCQCVPGLFPFSPQPITCLVGRQHLSAYVNVSFSGVKFAALCPTLSHPGKAPSLCTWGRVFCSSIVFPGLKMFSCHLGPRFMAKGMDFWIIESYKSAKNCLQ